MTDTTDTTGIPQPGRGTLGIEPDGSFGIRFIRTLPKPPEEAWEWIADPAKLQRWLPGSHITARFGGDVSFDFGDEGRATGQVTALSSPQDDTSTTTGHFLEHTWVWEGVPTSIVTWHFQAVPEGTELTLHHRELVEGPAREFALGWHMILDSLALDVAGLDTDTAWTPNQDLVDHYTGT